MSLPRFALKQASFPEMYERLLVGPLFRPWAELTLDALALTPGDRVLDVACGTGIVARVARERIGGAGQVVGVDLSPEMLAVARAAGPGIDWRQGDAARLPLGDGEGFDVVVCQQAMQFFPDKPRAARELRRALAEGGRLAVSTWRPDEEMPFLRELRRVAERHLGPVADRRHGFGEEGPLAALLREAGFRDVRVRTLWRSIRFEDGAVFMRMNAMALAGMSARAGTLGETERARLVDAIVADSTPLLQGGPALACEIASNLATARG